ncbi:hypothetical protein ASG31_02155 [Chryseobacterium sp. Leaf404]|uniref:DUF4126 domain-containing protein n=1 Tax=unclassified Chryseobacterium TaxID=2593645 RepID=UPI0006FB723D|nr:MULTISPECIES: DUF4126 domain-containing protein [unclassified Chryseobacterium]KQT22167.1 hypothetical protein ASG31_02155 [Chryseobacterium sp. Leaf404]
MLDNIPYFPYIASAFFGIGLAAATGFRVFLPLFAVSLSSYLGWIPMNESFEWLAGLPTLIMTGIATVAEILAYYLPFVDNLLDSAAIPLSTVAGSVLFATQFADLGTFPQWALAIIAGGGTAATISSGFAGLRAASTATTAGTGNFIVGSTETAGAGFMTIVSMLAPVIAFVLSIILLVVIVIGGKKLMKKFLAKNKTNPEME